MRQRPRPAAVLIALSVVILGGLSPDNSAEENATLVVRVEGLQSSKGSVALALFDDPAAFDRRSGAVRAEFVEPRKKRCAWVLQDLPPGSYALVAYHDQNGNRELDRRKPFGIPSEPYGFSNDARGNFGPPPFEAARFVVAGGSSTITIRIGGGRRAQSNSKLNPTGAGGRRHP